jgi:hypothetical protein
MKKRKRKAKRKIKTKAKRQNQLNKKRRIRQDCNKYLIYIARVPFIAHWPSMLPVTENVQHDPQAPWFFTGVTTPARERRKKSGKTR